MHTCAHKQVYSSFGLWMYLQTLQLCYTTTYFFTGDEAAYAAAVSLDCYNGFWDSSKSYDKYFIWSLSVYPTNSY